MATEIIQFEYRYILLDDAASSVADTLTVLYDKDIQLLGFSEFPHSPGRLQLDLIAEDTEDLVELGIEMGFELSPRKIGFLIRGDDEPGPVLTDILKRLAQAEIRVKSLHTVSAGAGRFGALLWVRPPDVAAAAKILDANVPIEDLVEEASMESFPASDAPALAILRQN